MDCRKVVQTLLWLGLLLMFVIACTDGRSKKVVIHVPYKVRKIKHTHTVYKTVHHHHREEPSSEEHEHFHHLHVHEDPSPLGQHSQLVPGLAIPEFLPDVPDIPHDLPVMTSLHGIPIFKKH